MQRVVDGRFGIEIGRLLRFKKMKLMRRRLKEIYGQILIV